LTLGLFEVGKLLTKNRQSLDESLTCLPSFVGESPTQQGELLSSPVGTHVIILRLLDYLLLS